MNYNELDKYAEGLVNMANWNTTTVLRTYYKLKPHVIDRKIQRLAKQKNIYRIFASVESDAENMNHLHLAFAGRNITKPQIAKSMNVDKKHILNLEKIVSKKDCLRYVSKALSREKRYVDAYHNIY